MSAKRYPRSTRQKDALRLVARQYAGANLHQPPEYFDDTLDVEWGEVGAYEVSRQLGKGKYGEVYESTHTGSRATCVIKIMRPVKEHRLRREIKILRHVRGGPNVVSLLEVVRDPDTKTPCFVFELVDAIGFRELQASITDNELRLYMFQLLRALDFCHSKGIMHRDVKPGNVLIDHQRKELRLIDWGLADFYHPGKEYPVRVATRFYKGPELLVDLRDYDYSLDVWGVGCMMAALLFRRPVFFRGEDEFDQLVKITKVLGSEGLHSYCHKYGISLDPRLDQMIGIRAAVPWSKFVNADNAHLCSPEAFDLLSQLLVYDHHARATCSEAMQHPYFTSVQAHRAAPTQPQAQQAAQPPTQSSHMQAAACQPAHPQYQDQAAAPWPQQPLGWAASSNGSQQHTNGFHPQSQAPPPSRSAAGVAPPGAMLTLSFAQQLEVEQHLQGVRRAMAAASQSQGHSTGSLSGLSLLAPVLPMLQPPACGPAGPGPAPAMMGDNRLHSLPASHAAIMAAGGAHCIEFLTVQQASMAGVGPGAGGDCRAQDQQQSAAQGQGAPAGLVLGGATGPAPHVPIALATA